MSRKSRYNEPTPTTITRQQWKVALYIRLSKEDENFGDSESVKTQRDILKNFIEEKSDMEFFDEYVDDGFSGTNFERPNFKRMIDDINQKKVNCVIVKDLSRFGRNSTETSSYVQILFPLYNIRFISVLDNVDSYINPNSVNDLLVPLKNILNESYARDISIKVKTACDTYRKQGLFIGSFACYGYKKAPYNHHKLIIDEPAANIVKLIYNLYLKYNSINRVVRHLNDNNILAPYAYKMQNNLNYKNHHVLKSTSKLWSASTVKTILTNQIYLGHMIQGKSRVLNYKNKKKIENAIDEWIIVENTHEPIIDKELFKQAQTLINKNSSYQNNQRQHITSCLDGLCYCGDCEHALRKSYPSSKNLKKQGLFYWRCGTHLIKKSMCVNHTIRNDILEDSVLKVIQKLTETFINLEKTLQTHNKKSKIIEENLDTLINQKKRILKLLEEKINQLYIDWKSELITETDYLKIKSNYENQIKNLKQEIENFKSLNNNILYNNTITKTLNQYAGITKLTYEVAHALIKRINLYENKKIEIIFTFQDEFQNFLKIIPDSM